LPRLAQYDTAIAGINISQLANDGMVSTDTCNTARKTRRLLCEAIRTVAIEQGFREESINVMENDCWNHLHNVCFGAVIKELTFYLDEVLKDDLSEIHPILRVTTDPSNIFRAIEKFFGFWKNCKLRQGIGVNVLRLYAHLQSQSTSLSNSTCAWRDKARCWIRGCNDGVHEHTILCRVS
jgi:hypothetical protein